MKASFTVFSQRLVLLAGLLFGLAATTWAQAPAWQAVVSAVPANFTSGASVAATATDASGNVYVAGYLAGTIDLGGTLLSSTGQSNLFVAKWSPVTQRFAWILQSGGIGIAYPTALAVNGNQIYLTGYFQGSPAFGGTTFTGAGSNDIFVAKITDAGGNAAFTWAYRAGGTGLDQANALAVSGQAVYLAGTFANAATFGPTTYTSAGGDDAFLTRLTDAGSSATFDWTQPVGGPSNEYASGVAAQGNSVYVTGLFAGTVAFGNLSLTGNGPPGLFVAKLTDTGGSPTYSWVRQAGGTGIVVPNALAVQGSQVYVAGRFQGTAAFGTLSVPNATTAAGAYDAFVAKLADTGSSASYVWAYGAGGPLTDYVNTLAVRGSAVYLAGSYRGTSSFGGISLTSTGLADDIFVARLTDAGPSASFAWALSAGGPDSDTALALAPTSTGVYVGGWVYGAATFGSQTMGTAGRGQTGFFTALPDATGLATTGAAAAPTRVALFPTPTPSGTLATVQLPAAGTATTVALTLFDNLGRIVRTATAPVAAGSQQVTFGVAGLAPGVYALRVAVGEHRGTARLVVE